MNDDKKCVFATAAVCSVISLLWYLRWFHSEALLDAVMGVVMFLYVGTIFLICAGFAIVTVVSVALSIWFVLEWCCRKVWRLFRRGRGRK